MLNELTDVISDAALVLPVAVLPGWNPLSIAAAIFFAVLTEMAGILGLAIGSTRRNDGPFGKSDRAFALGVLGCWLALGWPLGAWVGAAAPALWIVLCCVTIVNRIRLALVKYDESNSGRQRPAICSAGLLKNGSSGHATA